MRPAIILVIIYVITNLSAAAQSDSSKNFVQTFADSTIYGNAVIYKKPIIGRGYLTVDSMKVPLRTVRFFKTETNFFASTRYLEIFPSVSFAKRIVQGKINLFQKANIDVLNPYGTVSYSVKTYYNTGFNNIQRANYNSLKPLLKGNDESLAQLEKFKSQQNLQYGLFAGGAVIGGAGLVIMLAEALSSSLSSAFGAPQKVSKSAIHSGLALVATGTACTIASYRISITKHKYLKRAVAAYNK